MTKPVLNFTPTEEELEKITEVKNGKKVIGKARQQISDQAGKTIFFLDDGSEIIESDTGEILAGWE